jgi:hypothetical protein
MKAKTLFKAMDLPVIALGIAITLFIALRVYGGESSPARVIVRGEEKTWIFSLDGREELSIDGPIGKTVIAIGEGRAAIVSSPCAGQTCVAAGELRKNGQWAACLPNRVLLLVERSAGGHTGEAIDAISY